MNNSINQSGEIGFCGLLTIAFIVLKLTGFIDWPWLWVLAPIWIPLGIAILIVGIFLALSLVQEIKK